jgi:hypothetical protein
MQQIIEMTLLTHQAITANACQILFNQSDLCVLTNVVMGKFTLINVMTEIK